MFLFLVLCCLVREGVRVTRSWEGMNHSSWPNVAKVIFHIIWYSAKYLKGWEELTKGGELLLRDWLVIGQQVVSKCVVHHLFGKYIWYYNNYCGCFFIFSPSSILVNIYKYIYILSQSMRLFFCFVFLVLSPIALGEWLCGT